MERLAGVQAAQILGHEGQIASHSLGIFAVHHVEIIDDLNVGDGLRKRG